MIWTPQEDDQLIKLGAGQDRAVSARRFGKTKLEVIDRYEYLTGHKLDQHWRVTEFVSKHRQAF